MKITSHDEYGLRILLRIAREDLVDGMSIPAISEAEGISFHNTAKFCRILRNKGFLVSTKGHTGGYKLARPANKINLNVLIESLGGSLYNKSYCDEKSSVSNICGNSTDCSIRSLWMLLQKSLEKVLVELNLQDLVDEEKKLNNKFKRQFLSQ